MKPGSQPAPADRRLEGPGVDEYFAVAKNHSVSLLVVDDDAEFRSVVARRFQRRGCDVANTGSPLEALQLSQERRFDVAILDIAMPEMDGVRLLERLKQVTPETQVIMLTGQGTIDTAIRAMKLGAYDFLTKPCELAELEVQVQRAYEKTRLSRENQNLKLLLRRSEPSGEIIGKSVAIKKVLHLIDKVAPTESTVLIQGESGTGKELVARALHRGSPRAGKPLVVINCAALQETLLESELFGHEKGAFTSAVSSKEGLFEVADGGTLFIDEIGEMAGGLQAKLLRVLEDGRFRRVGSTKEIRIDVRILAATNKDLAKEAAAGRFREDLYYRLNVITISLPPLRERLDDIPLLVDHFLKQGVRGPRNIELDALAPLQAYGWPGNVRELANVIERAKILAEGSSITQRDLPSAIGTRVSAIDQKSNSPQTREDGSKPAADGRQRMADSRLSELERQHVQRILASQSGNKAKAARVLGISRRKLYRLLEKHGLGDSA
jgi:DNA-binding NtrC family response regulator